MIDMDREELIRLTEAVFPGRPHYCTKVRWATRGVRGVRLETVLLGGVRHTSAEAIQRFHAKINGAPQPLPPQAAAERAGRELAARGA